MLREDHLLYQRVLETDLLSRLPSYALKNLSAMARKERQLRYPQNHAKKKYGRMNKGFTQEEYVRFLQHVEHPKSRLAFITMHDLGLRIGEVVAIKLEHIDFLNRSLLVATEKSGTNDLLYLHDHIFNLLREWANNHHKAILAHQGFLFYSESHSSKRASISKDWLRNYFRTCREAAGLNTIYGMSDERKGRTPRRLFRISSHSNRHTFGTTLWRVTKDPKIVQAALRHQSSKSTDTYIHVQQTEVDAAIEQAFSIQEPFKTEQEQQPK